MMMMNEILSHSHSDILTASDDEHKSLSPGQVIVDRNTIAFDRCHDLGFNNPPTAATNDEHEFLLAARVIVDAIGAAPVMTVISAILELCKEIAKISNFLVENIRHTSYELFQEELDCCYQDSEKMVGLQLSKVLCEHSEAQQLSKPVITMTIQIFIISFCASEWEHYLDNMMDVHEL